VSAARSTLSTDDGDKSRSEVKRGALTKIKDLVRTDNLRPML
jgi:hypothetical protein